MKETPRDPFTTAVTMVAVAQQLDRCDMIAREDTYSVAPATRRAKMLLRDTVHHAVLCRHIEFYLF